MSCKLMLFFCCCSLMLKAQFIVDSQMSDTLGFAKELALIEQKIGPLPDSIRLGIRPLMVQYYGFDKNGDPDCTQLREGLLMVHESVVEDLTAIFEELQDRCFPIEKVVPANVYGLNRDSTGWSDHHSMEDNNSSAFNYRYITNSDRLSPHGMGIAIDFNPLFNPFESYHHDGKFVEPPHGHYDLNRPGTVSDDRVVGLFDKRGWIWGGRWNNPVDFQHFDKRARSRKHYLMKKSGWKDYFQYGDGDGALSLFEAPYFKKRKKTELFLSKVERDSFLYYASKVAPQILYQYLKDKKDSSWNLVADERQSAIELKRALAQYHQQKAMLLKSSQVGALQGKTLFLRSVASNEQLKKWEMELLQALKADLEHLGATVLLLKATASKGLGEGLKNIDFFMQADLVIEMELGQELMFPVQASNSNNYQVLYVPGAYPLQEVADPLFRFAFFRQLLDDQLTLSNQFAELLQVELSKEAGLLPVSRQLRGPNLLETAGIMMEREGIYARYLPIAKFCSAPILRLGALPLTCSEYQRAVDRGEVPKEQLHQIKQALGRAILTFLKRD